MVVAMSTIFWYCLFNIYVLFGVLFYLLFILLVSGHYLDAAIYDNLQDIEGQDFEQQQVGEQGKCP
jgi:membrane-associated PAP2 superfamily phosphatase